MACGRAEEHEARALQAQLEEEQAQTLALRETVRQWERKVEQVCATQRTLETNMDRLFTSAKAKVDERDKQIRALQLSTVRPR
ncbi:hypothetical protein AB1Y20_022274 [Prymnesium parvum]|uniref:Uncharacterized protein n=1 Tax=Prymnesium parvum TaxID=97485 RepID=A0AB34JIG8_PRYPA